MNKDINSLRLDDVKVDTPKRKRVKKKEVGKKSKETKAIRISLENYEFLREKAFKEDVTIKELADSILDTQRRK